MRNENFAERLFCDLRNANRIIAQPSYQIDGYKIGEHGIRQLVIGENRGKFGYSEGPVVHISDMSFTEAYNQLLTEILNMKGIIKFYSPVLPRKGVTECRLEEFHTVITRYVVDYLPGTDDLLARWDVMVSVE